MLVKSVQLSNADSPMLVTLLGIVMSVKLLQPENAEIHQKTDNRAFFEYSIEKLTGFGFALKNVSLDLHASDFAGNIVTEYEKRFADLGQPIYRLEAYRR